MVALIATGAFAMGQGGMMPSFSDFDTDGDGKVTQVEFENTQSERMSQNSTSGKMMRNAGNAPTFENLDLNSDDAITEDEFDAYRAEKQSSMRGQGGQGRGQGMYR